MSEASVNESHRSQWLASRVDPVFQLLPADETLWPEKIGALFPKPQGEPVFDPEEVSLAVKKLQTCPEVATGYPALDLAIKTGLVFIDFTFQGLHPKYGRRQYAEERHDGFPPTIIAAVDALSAWGLTEKAVALFRYWLAHFVNQDGTINYYGPSLSEYGQLLHLASRLVKRAGTIRWWSESLPYLRRLVAYLLSLRSLAEKEDGLLTGGPEADECQNTGKYFHNNAWVSRGLESWFHTCCQAGTECEEKVLRVARALREDTLKAIEATWPEEPEDWWLPPRVEKVDRPRSLTGTRMASYTNYRYWPELLSSQILPRPLAERLVNARLSAGGQFCGLTRFSDHLDDWPLADYLTGLWWLG
ncbi:MAG TPA: hypothetical protein PK644_07450, partial [bacterium]|nr:hypothetical protein [bacterium]